MNSGSPGTSKGTPKIRKSDIGIRTTVEHSVQADDPTGDLNTRSADEVLTILSRLNQDFGKTIIMVTDDPRAAKHATVIRNLDKGILLPLTLDNARPAADRSATGKRSLAEGWHLNPGSVSSVRSHRKIKFNI